MDKTDCYSFINGKPAYLYGRTAKTRNRRKHCDGSLVFPKLDKPRDVKFTAKGNGVTYDGPKGLSRTQYEIRRIGACTVINYDATPETKIWTGPVSRRMEKLARKRGLA
jgi:hypothetical protein